MTLATPSIFDGVRTILRARWQIARNTFWRGTIARKITLVVVLVFLVAAAYGLYRFSRFVVWAIRLVQAESPELIAQLGDIDSILAAVPSIALLLFSLPLLLTSVSFALSTLYLSRDLDTLLVTPVPVRSVFLARFIEGLGTTYLILFALLAPALLGYGLEVGYGPGFFPALIIVLLLLPLLPVSIGTLLTMLLIRFIPARRLREILTVVGGLFGLIVYVGSQLFTRSADDLASAETAERLLSFNLPWLPTAWGARLLVAAGTGDLAGLALYGLAYGVATLGVFAVCVVLAERLYYNGLASLSSTNGGRTRQRRRAERTQPAFLSGPLAAIIRKDVRILPRDLQQLSQLLVPLGISVFWIWQLFSEAGTLSRGLPDSEAFASTGLVSIGVIVCVLIGSHLGLTGVNREAQGYWLIHLAPINPWIVLLAKWLLAWLPFVIVGTAFMVLIGLLQQPSIGQLLLDWLLVVLTGVGVAGITVGFGAAFPRLDWQQPNRMNSTRAGCFGSLLYMVYTGTMLALTLGPQFFGSRFEGWLTFAGWIGAIVITALAFWLPLLLGANRLRTMEF